MAKSQQPEDEGDRCVTAWEAVSGVALEHCQSRDAIQQVVARFLGVDPDDIAGMGNPSDVTDNICEDRQQTRQWVAVRTAELVDDESMTMPEALDDAWDEVRDACGEMGFAV